jgi:hypothetical protein
VLFPYIYVLQPKLIHFYQTSSLLPNPFPIVVFGSLGLLYSFLWSEHINHIQVYLYTMEFYSATKENEILSFVGKWMELEKIIFSEVSQA